MLPDIAPLTSDTVGAIILLDGQSRRRVVAVVALGSYQIRAVNTAAGAIKEPLILLSEFLQALLSLLHLDFQVPLGHSALAAL